MRVFLSLCVVLCVWLFVCVVRLFVCGPVRVWLYLSVCVGVCGCVRGLCVCCELGCIVCVVLIVCAVLLVCVVLICVCCVRVCGF